MERNHRDRMELRRQVSPRVVMGIKTPRRTKLEVVAQAQELTARQHPQAREAAVELESHPQSPARVPSTVVAEEAQQIQLEQRLELVALAVAEQAEKESRVQMGPQD